METIQQQLQNDNIAEERLMRSLRDILSILNGMDRNMFSAKDLCEVLEISETAFHSWLKRNRTKPTETRIVSGPNEGGPKSLHKETSRNNPKLFAQVKKDTIKVYQEVSPEYLKALLP